MGHGENNTLTKEEKKLYLADVKEDFNQLKKQYPFSTICIAPTVEITPVIIKTVAACQSLIDEILATREDFMGDYSRELVIVVPFEYKTKGCQVFGGEWINEAILADCDRHFHGKRADGKYNLCVGLPESFKNMENVILESVRTAENMLIAYEQVQKGITNNLKLIAYSHGEKGKDEYRRNRKRYRTKD